MNKREPERERRSESEVVFVLRNTGQKQGAEMLRRVAAAASSREPRVSAGAKKPARKRAAKKS